MKDPNGVSKFGAISLMLTGALIAVSSFPTVLEPGAGNVDAHMAFAVLMIGLIFLVFGLAWFAIIVIVERRK